MEWINVKERLPDFDCKTIVVVVDDGDDPPFVDTDSCSKNGEFRYWGDQDVTVTHWIKLPEIPTTK